MALAMILRSAFKKPLTDNQWDAWCDFTAIWPNLGFTGGNNIVLRKSLQSADPPDYVLLLNADTIVKPDSFKSLVTFMDAHPQVGIAGSRLEDLEGRVHRSAFRFPSPMSELDTTLRWGPISSLLKNWVVAPPPSPEPCEVDWVAGASMIIRRQVLLDAGLLDEGPVYLFR